MTMTVTMTINRSDTDSDFYAVIFAMTRLPRLYTAHEKRISCHLLLYSVLWAQVMNVENCEMHLIFILY